jgi:glycosyltransferase involved in cell wall biosynthesis
MARIAIILGRLAVGGATSHAIDEALYLKDRHEVLLITGLPAEYELNASYLLDGFTGFDHQTIPGFFRTRKIWKHWKTYFTVRKMLRDFKPDVVHTHTPVAGFIGRMAAATLGVKCIVHSYHGLLFKGYFPAWQNEILIAFERWLGRKSHFLLALSEGQKKDLVDKYRIAPPGKVLCVPIGVDIASFAKRENEEAAVSFRNRLNLSRSDVLIGMVGRLVSIKNHQFGLRTFQKLQQTIPHAKLLIVGDGPTKQPLEAFCQKLGLSYSSDTHHPDGSAFVVFASWQKNMPEVMAALDVVLLTSDSEGTPMCVMEAMAAGKPVVSTCVGGVPEMIDHLVDGMLVEPGDLEGLVAALHHLVNDKALAHSIGSRAQLTAEKSFDKFNGLKQIEELVIACQKS